MTALGPRASSAECFRKGREPNGRGGSRPSERAAARCQPGVRSSATEQRKPGRTSSPRRGPGPYPDRPRSGARWPGRTRTLPPAAVTGPTPPREDEPVSQLLAGFYCPNTPDADSFRLVYDPVNLSLLEPPTKVGMRFGTPEKRWRSRLGLAQTGDCRSFLSTARSTSSSARNRGLRNGNYADENGGWSMADTSVTRKSTWLSVALVAAAAVQIAFITSRLVGSNSEPTDTDEIALQVGDSLVGLESRPLSPFSEPLKVAGEPIVLAIFNSKCPWCDSISGDWATWLASERPYRVIGLTTDEASNAEDYITTNGWKIETFLLEPTRPLTAETEMPLLLEYRVSGRTPWLFVTDESGIVVYEDHGSGFLRADSVARSLVVR